MNVEIQLPEFGKKGPLLATKSVSFWVLSKKGSASNLVPEIATHHFYFLAMQCHAWLLIVFIRIGE